MMHFDVQTTPDLLLFPSDGQPKLCWLPLTCQICSVPPRSLYYRFSPVSFFLAGGNIGSYHVPAVDNRVGMWVSLREARASA